MKRSSKDIRAHLIISFISIFSISCKKFLEIKPPIDKVVASTVFTNDQSATSAVTGIYGRMMQSLFYCFNGSTSVLGGLSAGEIYNSVTDVEQDQFTSNSLNSRNDIIKTQLWDALYKYIYHANSCLEGLNNSLSVTQSLKLQLTGELKFIRALCYFYLVNFYGDVPLELATDYRLNATMPRTSVSDVNLQIIADLKDAQSMLLATYSGSDRVRPNKLAATALLSRVYLYQEDWINAEALASLVINSGVYALSDNLNNVFLFDSPETIWQLQTVLDSYKTAEGNAFNPYPVSAIPGYPLTSFLSGAFETGDQRKIQWVGTNTVDTTIYSYPYKYKVKYAFLTPLIEYNIVLRYAEMFLIRSEARSQQNNIIGAQEDLNVIRNRSGLSNTAANNSVTLLAAIEHERRIEFFAEWGHRWFDLKRTNRADAVLGIEKAPNWQSTDVLYPIPFSQLQLNPFLTQNAGY